jgi:hypothetical protein
LTRFLTKSWKKEEGRKCLIAVTLIIRFAGKCFEITKDAVGEVSELICVHKEADTRLLLHAGHATGRLRHVIVISEDTDVFVILLAFSAQIGGQLHLRRGKKNKIRFIDVSKLTTIIVRDACIALSVDHAWTGCDSVSTFPGQEKVNVATYNLIH